MKFYFTILLVVLIFCSCKNSTEKMNSILNGTWSIDSLIYKNFEIRGCLMLNVISFNNDSISSLPTTCNNCDSIEEWDSKAIYKLIYKNKNEMNLLFKTDNRFFLDTFKLIFFEDDKNKVLKILMKSRNGMILCTKGLYNYENIDALKKIINVKLFKDYNYSF